MQIIGIDVFNCNTPFQNNYHSAHIFRMKAESVIIKMSFDNGVSGYGESAPRAYVTGETPASVAALIRDHFSPLLLGMEVTSVNDIERIIGILEDTCREREIYSYLSAVGAVDLALFDGLSRNLEMPLSGLLGPIVREAITYTLPIPLLPLDTIRELSTYLTGAEFSSIKVLMAESVEENIARLQTVRSIFGSDMEIGIEANGRWTYEKAIDNLTQLREFNITVVEQPVHGSDIGALKKIRENTGIPVMVDESMCTLSDAQLLIDSGACDVLNIKISKCGGLLKAKKIAEFALSRGVRFQLGTHVGETPILTRAGQTLVLISPNVIHFEGLSFLLFKDLQAEDHLMAEINGQTSSEAAHAGINVGNQSFEMIDSFHL